MRPESSPGPLAGCGLLALFLVLQCCGGGVVSLAVIGAWIAVTGGADPARLMAISSHPLLLGSVNLVVAAVVIALGVLLSRRRPAEALALRSFPPLVLLPVLVTCVGASILLSEADNLLRSVMPAPDFLVAMFTRIAESPWAFFPLVIVAPLTEELLLRGLILGGVRPRWGDAAAILWTSALFALLHVNPYQLVGAFFLGAFFAWLVVRTGSVWPGVVGHAASNGLAPLLLALGVLVPGYTSMDAPFQPWWLDLTGLGLVVVGIAGVALIPKRA